MTDDYDNATVLQGPVAPRAPLVHLHDVLVHEREDLLEHGPLARPLRARARLDGVQLALSLLLSLPLPRPLTLTTDSVCSKN